MDLKSVVMNAADAKASHDSPAKMKKAAQDFEALMIGQMLKSVRESGSGGGWSDGDQSGDVALEMAEQQMAQMLSSNGGLGLAQLITKGLTQKAAGTNSVPTHLGIAPAVFKD